MIDIHNMMLLGVISVLFVMSGVCMFWGIQIKSMRIGYFTLAIMPGALGVIFTMMFFWGY